MRHVYYAAYENRLAIEDSRESCNVLDLTSEGKVKCCYLCEQDFIRGLSCLLDFLSSSFWTQKNGRWSFGNLLRTYSPLYNILSVVQWENDGDGRCISRPLPQIKIPFD